MSTKSLSRKRRDASFSRTKFAGGRNGGRPRSNQLRCLCGAMTLRRARGKSREHETRCEFGK